MKVLVGPDYEKGGVKAELFDIIKRAIEDVPAYGELEQAQVRVDRLTELVSLLTALLVEKGYLTLAEAEKMLKTSCRFYDSLKPTK